MLNRGQTELLGLTMVVVLLSLGLVFVLVFIVLSDDGAVDSRSIDKQLAVAFNDALLETTSTCNNIRFQDLISRCFDQSALVCEGVSVCEYVETEIKTIFDLTLEKWNVLYNYEISLEPRVLSTPVPDPVVIKNGECLRDVTTNTLFFVVDGGTVHSVFKVCERTT